MYRPIQTKAFDAVRQSTSLFAQEGENKRDLPQLLDPKYALKIINYIITASGGLTKRGGLSEFFSVVGLDPIIMLEGWGEDIIMFGYDTTLAAYTISTSTITPIKTDFVEVGMEGQAYGPYFFVASPGDKIGRVSQTLAYDAQTVNFTIGEMITGGTSGATAIVLEDADGGATGTLTLGTIVGTFLNNELITGSVTGSADVNGTLGFTYTVIANAPIARTIRVVGPRLYAGNTQDDPNEVRYSEVDPPVNPPFTIWSTGTAASNGGRVSYRNSGDVRSIESLGETVMVFSDRGKWGFQIQTQDVGGTLTKVDTTIMYRQDFGGFRGALTTPKGLFYVNEAGLWQLTSVGQPNIPFSDQEGLATLLLGIDYFDDISLLDTDMAYDKKRNTLYLTGAKNSAQNNLVLAYNVDQKAISEFSGWAINRFLTTEDKIYGGSAIETTVFELFDGFSDNGSDIWTEFYTELKSGELETRQMLLGTYIQGIFSLSTQLKICYDIFDSEGNFIQNKMCQLWNPNLNSSTIANGWGIEAFGEDPFGGDSGPGGYVAIESFAGARDYIRNFQRIRVRITGNDELPHVLNWVKLLIKKEIPIRRRNLVKL